MRRVLFGLLVVLAFGAALVWAGSLGIGPVLITREGEQKIVLFFGSPVRVQAKPGVWWRLPLLTEVRVFDGRYLYLNTPSSEVPTRDQERIVVDNYVVWRIGDPLRFYASFPGGMSQAEDRINEVVRSNVREVIGRHTITEVLTDARVAIVEGITRQADEDLGEGGIVVRDVRINRTELPEGTIVNLYARMRTERERLARKYRAEGAEEGRRIRADADREAQVTVAEARRDAEMLRGEGDARAAGVYAQAYGADPEFYGFVRSLEAYRKTLGEGTTLVLPPSSEFFRIFEDPDARRPR
jgi:membrane protease subunit HflC